MVEERLGCETDERGDNRRGHRKFKLKEKLGCEKEKTGQYKGAQVDLAKVR